MCSLFGAYTRRALLLLLSVCCCSRCCVEPSGGKGGVCGGRPEVVLVRVVYARREMDGGFMQEGNNKRYEDVSRD